MHFFFFFFFFFFFTNSKAVCVLRNSYPSIEPDPSPIFSLNMSKPELQAVLLTALAQLTSLKEMLEHPPAVAASTLQSGFGGAGSGAATGGITAGITTEQQISLNIALNTSIIRLREVEEAAAAGGAGSVDADFVDFVSSESLSHPDALLQQRLQEALDARLAADIRCAALRAFAVALELEPRNAET